jgi:hypothetical protein
MMCVYFQSPTNSLSQENVTLTSDKKCLLFLAAQQRKPTPKTDIEKQPLVMQVQSDLKNVPCLATKTQSVLSANLFTLLSIDRRRNKHTHSLFIMRIIFGRRGEQLSGCKVRELRHYCQGHCTGEGFPKIAERCCVAVY